MGTTSNGSLKSLRGGHVGVNVTDLDRSLDFYVRVFGFDMVGSSAPGTPPGRRHAFLAREGRILVTLWQQADVPYASRAAGMHHLSFEVDTIEEVQAAERVLREIGTPFQYDGVVPHAEAADSGGIFFSDPDGTRLEIFTAHGASGQDAPVESAPTCGFF
ncbi:VOC family protein [Streptacidiphilus sp. 4-A2]|nr:VOC family protein [Streptacidiphilus sp. 4-A2]